MSVNHAPYDHPHHRHEVRARAALQSGKVFGPERPFRAGKSSGDRVQFDAVLFDMGGVLVTGPFAGFARYEIEHSLPADTIRTINATNADSNGWARYERGEMD